MRSIRTGAIEVRAKGVKAKVDRAALELFAANGVDGVSIGDIATAAAVSQGALYRHYPSKDELAWVLFSTAYLRTGAELDEIARRSPMFQARVGAMVEHFCALYDTDPALFRFMLITQHGFLPRVRAEERTPVDAVADIVKEAVQAGEVAALDPLAGAAAILGVILQTAVFRIYGRLEGALLPRAPGLARAAIAAVAALGQTRA
ncbi:MAG TPA: helix-turn-helix domain-containing protein [Stellaceae bacterium]|nr:helix-turn-helix domain-containing protein [Stellaceae bacterium]